MAANVSAPAHTATVAPKPAAGPGALAGFAVTCAACGTVGSSSLETLARQDAAAHERYWSRKR